MLQASQAEEEMAAKQEELKKTLAEFEKMKAGQKDLEEQATMLLQVGAQQEKKCTIVSAM